MLKGWEARRCAPLGGSDANNQKRKQEAADVFLLSLQASQRCRRHKHPSIPASLQMTVKKGGNQQTMKV
jgi:hypothetical protein